MKYCKYCKAKIDTTNDFCPLCFNHLTQTDGEYSQLYTPRLVNETTNITKRFLTKLFLFLTICAITVCFFVNYLTDFSVRWFWVVTFGIIYVWVLIAHTIMSRQSAFKKVLLQLITIIVLLFFTERVSTTQNWLLQYVYPSISFTVVFVTSMILFIGHKRNENISGFLLIVLMMGIISLLFIIFNLVEFKLLNFINTIVCALTVLGLLVFGMASIRQDLSKKFHI